MKILFLFFSMLIFISCTTAPPASQLGAPVNLNKTSGFWEAKANIKDLTTQKSYQVSLDITGIAPDKLRIDVTGTLGIPIASIVINKNEVSYSLYRQKKFFQGVATEHALKPVFNIEMNPKTLINISFDKEIEGMGWSCITGAGDAIESCAHQGAETVQWRERNGEQKRVVVSGKTFELQIVYKSYSKLTTKVLEDSKVFHLEPPKDFTRYNIP